MTLNEATHTYASYSFAAYCEALCHEKRGKYFSEAFGEKERESAFGPHNGCKGACEGTGWVPVSKDDMTQPLRSQWVKAEMDSPSVDGWHFLPCPTCQPVNDGTEHITRNGNKFTLRREGKEVAAFEKTIKESVEITEAVEKDEKGNDKNKYDPDKKKKADNERDSDPQKKQDAKNKRNEKEKEREKKKLMPYEFSSQKEAERAASHLGLHGSHTAGNGIYKPGSSEHSLRDAVHRKKAKQKMKGGRFHREEAEGLSTGAGIANPDVVLGVVKRVVKGD